MIWKCFVLPAKKQTYQAFIGDFDRYMRGDAPHQAREFQEP